MFAITHKDLLRIDTNLRKRFAIGGRGNVMGVAFGFAERDSCLDLDRGPSICFLVRKKWSRRNAGRQGAIPKDLTIRPRTGKYADSRMRLKTDVIQKRVFQPVGLAATLQLPTRLRELTVGTLISWQDEVTGDQLWGCLTVGHAFSGATIGDRISIRPNGTGNSVTGTLLVISDTSDEVDAAIVQVRSQGVERLGLADTTVPPQNISAMTETALIAAAGGNLSTPSVGATFRPDGSQAFIVSRYHVTNSEVVGLGVIRNVLEVEALHPEAFIEGTSGSFWSISNKPACVQYAATPPDFKIGYGQSLLGLKNWAEDQLKQVTSLKLGTFRLIRGF